MKVFSIKTAAHLVATSLLIALITTPASPARHSNGPVLSSEEAAAVADVVTQFKNHSLSDCVALMDRLRPEAVSKEDKLALKAAGFPLVDSNTEITNSLVLKELYKRTQSVLEFHHRAGIVEFIAFRNSDPVLMSKPGAFIAISTRAIELTKNDDALSGVTAHELSHEYFAMQFLDAYNTHNLEKHRKIELLCDAFATVTLIKLKKDPQQYAVALSAIVHNSQSSERLNDGTHEMPTLEARLQVISQVQQLFTQTAAK